MRKTICKLYTLLLALLIAADLVVPALADTMGPVGFFFTFGIWWVLIAAAVVIPMAFIIRGIIRECRGLRKSKEDKEHEENDS